MAQVQAQLAGGEITPYKGVDTVKDLRKKMGVGEDHDATVNGEPADDDEELENYNFVAFAPRVRGGK